MCLGRNCLTGDGDVCMTAGEVTVVWPLITYVGGSVDEAKRVGHWVMSALEGVFAIMLFGTGCWIWIDQKDSITFFILMIVLIAFLAFEIFGHLALRNVNLLVKNKKNIFNKLKDINKDDDDFSIERLKNMQRYEAQMGGLREATIPSVLSLGQNLLISLGLIGTFFGLTLGLFDAIPLFAKGGTENMTDAMEALFGGAKLAFAKSLAGVMAAALWSFRYAMIESAWERCYHGYLDFLKIQNTDDLLIQILERQSDIEDEIKKLTNKFDDTQSSLSTKISNIETAIRSSGQPSLADQIASVTIATKAVEGAIRAPGQATLTEQISSVTAATKSVEQAIRAPGEQDNLSRQLLALTDLIQEIGEQLPEKFGNSASSGVSAAISQALAPKLHEVSEALKGLSNTKGGIADKVNQDIQGDVSALSGGLQQLRAELQQVATALAALPADVHAGITKGSEAAGQELSGQLKAAAGALAQALTQAAERFSDEIGGTARELQAGGVEITASTKELQQALAASLGLAMALKEAGDQVSESLTGVHLPITVAASAINGAATKFEGAGASAATASDRLQSLGKQILQAEELMRALWVEERAATQDLNSMVSKTASLLKDILPQMELLMQASASLVTTLGQAGVQTQQQTGQAMELLMAALTKFGEDLKVITVALEAQSGQLFTDTSKRAQEAAERVSAALEKGAEKFAQTMGDIDARSERLGRLFGLLDHTTEKFAKHGADLTQNLGVASTSLGEVAGSLQLLPPELNRAMEAMRLEHQSIEGLGKLLSAATGDVRALLKAVKDERAELQKEVPARLEQIELARKRIENSWQQSALLVTAHIERLVAAQASLVLAWEQAEKARTAGIEHNAKELARYAALVEQSLRLPTDLRNLDKAIIELVDVLDALKRLLQPPAAPPSSGKG